MTWQAEQPYNQLPTLPPDLNSIETKAVLKACISARTAVAELKKAGELIPNQSMLINLLPLLEAKDSSEIENIAVHDDQTLNLEIMKHVVEHKLNEFTGFIDEVKQQQSTLD
ncbi:Fic/DOC family N-terminal domain-containing protein [Marinomonas mediterranea]|uniref:Fic/DOC family N-terminal domain-containing protein n=1 Tax=Marinomonas mediterranea TaxID=119864 RepID=UPI002349E999|nr:Fic/DOC family N-terminal domain-containing protein [Marinomonas mediterranea]